MDIEARIKAQLGELMVQVLGLQTELDKKDAIIAKLQDAIDKKSESVGD